MDRVRQTTLKRPNPLQWIWYAFGGGLPEDRREWVLHDLTAKTRALRHLVRSMLLISPLVGFWLFVPASLGLRLALVLMGLIVGLASRICQANGTDKIPAVRETLGRLASLEALIGGLVHGQIDAWENWPEGFATPTGVVTRRS